MRYFALMLLLVALIVIPTFAAATDPLADVPDATIAIVTEDVTHRAPVYIKQVLDAKGHTCTIIAITDVTATNLDGYDAIVVTRTKAEPQDTHIRAYIDKGIPVWAGTHFTTGTQTDGGAISLGMIGKMSTVGTRNNNYLLDSTPTHPITYLHSTPSTIPIYSAATYMSLAPRADGYAGTRVAEYSASDSSIAILAIEKDTLDLFGNPYGARCGFIGWIYSTGTITLTTEAQDILDRAIRWSLIEPAPEPTPTPTLTEPTPTQTQVGFRPKATAPIPTLDESPYLALTGAFGGSNQLNETTEGVDWLDMKDAAERPYTDLIGPLFYVIVFAIPFLMQWLRQGSMAVPAAIGIILGGIMLTKTSAEYHLAAIAFIALSILAVVWGVIKDRM